MRREAALSQVLVVDSVSNFCQGLGFELTKVRVNSNPKRGEASTAVQVSLCM
jgi:hypothetical protein